MQILKIFGLYVRKLLFGMRIKFITRKSNSPLGIFSKSTILIIQKSFFSEINPRKNLLISSAQKHKTKLKSLWAVLGSHITYGYAICNMIPVRE